MTTKNSLDLVSKAQPGKLEKFFDPLAASMARARNGEILQGDKTTLFLLASFPALLMVGAGNLLLTAGEPIGWQGVAYMGAGVLNLALSRMIVGAHDFLHYFEAKISPQQLESKEVG